MMRDGFFACESSLADSGETHAENGVVTKPRTRHMYLRRYHRRDNECVRGYAGVAALASATKSAAAAIRRTFQHMITRRDFALGATASTALSYSGTLDANDEVRMGYVGLGNPGRRRKKT